jgi:DNA-binding response OmpR family regulator
MRVIVTSCDVQLAAAVKDQFDGSRVGVTEIAHADALDADGLAPHWAQPSVMLFVNRRLDRLAAAVCRRAGQLAAAWQVPLIVALDEATDEDRVLALEAGADAIVQPLDPRNIERHVRSALKRPNITRPFVGRDLSIDADGSTVLVSGRSVRLTGIEAEVLRVLVHEQDRAMPRAQIALRLGWQRPSRALDVHVAHLRRKLGPIGRRITTVTKVGYRYSEGIGE